VYATISERSSKAAKNKPSYDEDYIKDEKFIRNQFEVFNDSIRLALQIMSSYYNALPTAYL